eukprot:6210250-Pleurochrysis_carterae.AAC.1
MSDNVGSTRGACAEFNSSRRSVARIVPAGCDVSDLRNTTHDYIQITSFKATEASDAHRSTLQVSIANVQ